ncbi:MAG: M56 family metallopeptidase [Bacteroidota bacterium]
MLELLDTLGRASVGLVWLPILVWTGLWLLSEIALRVWHTHPLPRYRAMQAVLLALPLGLALAPLVDPAVFAPSLNEPIVITVEAGVAPLQDAPPSAAPTEPEGIPFSPWMALGTVLIGGSLLALVRLGQLTRDVWTLRRLRRALPAADSGDLAAEAEGITRSLGLRTSVPVVQTDVAAVPMTFGIWTPIVVLPASLRGEERRLALAHELVHVHRRDALSAALEAVVSAVFGFHPGVHRLASRCELLREMACDATLLSRPTIRRSAYAGLISAFALPADAPRLRAAVGMAASPSHVHQRLTAMTGPLPLLRRSTALLGWALAALVLTSASLAVTASRALAQEKRVIIRSLELTEKPVIVVDGERQDDIETINELDVHSINVVEGEDAQNRFGEERVIEVITEEEAQARGLPENDATFETFSISSDGSEGAGFRFNSSGLRIFDATNALSSDSLEVILEQLSGGTSPVRFRLLDDLDESAFEVREGESPIRLRLREMMEDESFRLHDGDSPAVARIQERLRSLTEDGNTFEVRGRVIDSLRTSVIRLRDGEPGGVFRGIFSTGRVDEDGEVVAGRSRLSSLFGMDESFDFSDLPGVDTGEIQSLQLTNVNGERRVVLRLKNGEVREYDLNGGTFEEVRLGTEADKAGAVASTPFEGVRAQPNPASDQVSVAFQLAEAAEVRLQVFDIEGRLVTDLQRRASAGRQALEVDVSNFAPGTYIYRLRAPGAPEASGRFTVAR